MSLLKRRSQLLKFLKGLFMFCYKKHLIITVGLLLSTSLFSSEFEETKLQAPNSHLSTNSTNTDYNGYQEYFSIKDQSKAPDRPENVSKRAFYSDDFLGSGKWILLSKKYVAQSWHLHGGAAVIIEKNSFPSNQPKNLALKSENLGINWNSPERKLRNLALKWEHIRVIWNEDGSLYHALPIWKTYCDTHQPEFLGENFAKFAEFYNSNFPGVSVDRQRLKDVLESYQQRVIILKSDLRVPCIDSMEKFFDKVMKEVSISTQPNEEKVEG